MWHGGKLEAFQQTAFVATASCLRLIPALGGSLLLYARACCRIFMIVSPATSSPPSSSPQPPFFALSSLSIILLQPHPSQCSLSRRVEYVFAFQYSMIYPVVPILWYGMISLDRRVSSMLVSSRAHVRYGVLDIEDPAGSPDETLWGTKVASLSSSGEAEMTLNALYGICPTSEDAPTIDASFIPPTHKKA